METFYPGDRVRARNKRSTEEVVFTVRSVAPYYISSASIYLEYQSWDFELIERALVLPETAGIYYLSDGGNRRIVRSTRGDWLWFDFTAGSTPTQAEAVDTDSLRRLAPRLVLEYEYKDHP